MENQTLGTSPLSSSRLAYGCWRIGGNCETAESSPERLATGGRAVLAAYEAGITLFDNADIYCGGEAEKIFGAALREVPDMRQRILVASKCGIRKQGDPQADAPYRYDFSAGHIVWSCEQSLKRMGVECIDLYMLHRPDYLWAPEEVAGAFSRLLQSGKVRQFGVSNFKPSQVTTLQKACPMPLVVNQVEISLMRIDCLQDGTLDQCQSEKITAMAWSPLAAGRIASNDPIDLRDHDHARRSHMRESLDAIARDHDSSRPVVALAWLLRHPAKIVPVLGSTDPKRIKELATAVDVVLSREEWYRLLEASHGGRLP